MEIKYEIYQIETKAPYRFERFDYAKEHGFNFQDYSKVHVNTKEVEDQKTDIDILNMLYEMSNTVGLGQIRTLSMSDIICLSGLNKKRTYYYIDAFGFKDVTKII